MVNKLKVTAIMQANPKFSQSKRLIGLEFKPIVHRVNAVNEDTVDYTMDPSDTDDVTRHKSLGDSSYETSGKNIKPVKKHRDLILTHKEAQAASPDDIAACGEEDIGSGLEFLVTRDDHIK